MRVSPDCDDDLFGILLDDASASPASDARDLIAASSPKPSTNLRDTPQGPRGRLLRADRAGQQEEYVYGADGRLAMTINGKDYVLAHDGDQMIAAMEQNGQTAWEVVAGVQPDEILEYEAINVPATGRYIPVTDHRNSIVGWWNATTAQTEHILEYTPYGRIRLLAPDGTLRCEEEGSGTDCVGQWSLPPFGFAGAYRSVLTGVSYMRARWYSPQLGQFLTEDPLGAIDSYNPYAYAAMDPINLWDPYGLASQGTALNCPGFVGDLQNAIMCRVVAANKRITAFSPPHLRSTRARYSRPC